MLYLLGVILIWFPPVFSLTSSSFSRIPHCIEFSCPLRLLQTVTDTQTFLGFHDLDTFEEQW